MRNIISYFKNLSLLKKLIWIFVILPGIPFIFFTISFAAYLFWPQDYSQVVEPIEINEKTNHLTLLFHGVKDTPENWATPLESKLSAVNGDSVQIQSVDWSNFADSPLKCSVSGKKIGHEIADKILNSRLESVHLVGHSCGSFAVLGLCESLKERAGHIKVVSTYLAPVSVYGGFFWKYGTQNFGVCADFSEAYIDLEDKVPGANVNLDNAYTFEISSLRKQNNLSETPHNWPARYYGEKKLFSYPITNEKITELNKIYVKGGATAL